MKQASLALAILGLMIRGYFMYQANQIQSAKQVLQSRQTIDSIRHGMQGPDAEADATARGKTTAATAATAPANAPAPQRPAVTPTAVSNPNPAVANAERGEIDAALKAVHLTTIMPGQPGLVIIDKQEYSEGEALPLPKGRKATIVAVQDDGVRLTCNGMTFHLDAPAGPDLAALRKKK